MDTETLNPELMQPVFMAANGLLALFGLINLLFGFKLFKALVTLVGFALGAGVGTTIATHYDPDNVTALLIGFICGGILLAILSFALYKIGLFLLGAFITFLFVSPVAMELGEIPGWIVTILAALLVGAVAVSLVNLMIQLMTALMGAFLLVFGGSYYFGGPNLAKFLFDLVQTTDTIILPFDPVHLGLALAAGLLGFAFQWITNREKKPKEEE